MSYLQRLGVGRVTGPNNHAGDLAPLTSPWGAILFTNTGMLIAQPPPIGHQGTLGFNRAFGGTVGGFSSLSASVIALAVEQQYGGDAPQTLQPTLQDPVPWNRV